jgi:hypothetical protein
MDMAVAMLLGMVLGSAVHLVLALVLSPLLGLLHLMVPGSLVGTYGGVLFAMRNAMQPGSRTIGAAVLVGAFSGTLPVSFGLQVQSHHNATLGRFLNTSFMPSADHFLLLGVGVH